MWREGGSGRGRDGGRDRRKLRERRNVKVARERGGGEEEGLRKK